MGWDIWISHKVEIRQMLSGGGVGGGVLRAILSLGGHSDTAG